MPNDIIYLACPYTHPDPQVRLMRFELATAAAAELIKQGRIVFSPITMTHPIELCLADREAFTSDFWCDFDEAFMEHCSEMKILEIPGWAESSGIKREIAYFRGKGKPVSFMSPQPQTL